MISSHPRLVDRVCVKVEEYWERINPGFVSSPLVQVTREMLLHAIEHGNEGIPDRRVVCTLERLDESRCKIITTNEGTGSQRATESAHNGTPWLERINRIADQLTIDSGEHRICAYVSTKAETKFPYDDEDGQRRITPTGDIRNSAVADFRGALLDWYGSPLTSLILDMQHVSVIDSVGLSLLFSFHRLLDSAGPRRSCLITNIDDELYPLFTTVLLDRLYTMSMREKSREVPE